VGGEFTADIAAAVYKMKLRVARILHRYSVVIM